MRHTIRPARALAVATVLAALTLALLPGHTWAQDATPAPTGAEIGTGSDAGGDTTAVAINTRDESNLFRFAFAVKRTMQDVVDNSNVAAAIASCTECQTVAASFQVVLILSDPQVVTTENLALAMNIECSMCETLASAYQYVLTTGGPVTFTAEGSRELAAIRRDLVELARSDLPLEGIIAGLEDLQRRLEEVLANHLVPAGAPEPATTSPSPTPTPSPTSSPSSTTSASPSASASASPTSPSTDGASP